MLVRGDARAIPLADQVADCVVTSPPYWGLRTYELDGQIGLEETPAEYLEELLAVFREVHRVLKPEGTLWLNLGDCYVSAPSSGHGWDKSTLTQPKSRERKIQHAQRDSRLEGRKLEGLKPKDMVGMPWTVALALRNEGWYLRRDIIWHKLSPMPEAVKDRPTSAHEYLFLLAKSRRYYYDAEAIKEPAVTAGRVSPRRVNPKAKVPAGWDTRPGSHRHLTGRYPAPKQNAGTAARIANSVETRSARTVWSLATEPYHGAHMAVFPTELAKRCILAGCPAGGLVFDPFVGSGTTVKVAIELGRRGLGMDLKHDYLHDQARERIKTTVGMGW